MLVKAYIYVDFIAGSEKSSSTMGRMTMGHVLAQSVAVEGLGNEKKVFGSAGKAQKKCRTVTIAHGQGPSSSWKETFFVVSYGVVTCFLSLFQASNNAMKVEARPPTPSLDIS